MLEVSLWRGGKEQRSLDSLTLVGYDGAAVARVYQASPFQLPIVARQLRQAAPGPKEDPADRWSCIEQAGHLFRDDSLGGFTGDEHATLVTRATGCPLFFTRTALRELAAGLCDLKFALQWQAPGADLSAFSSHRVALLDGRTFAWVPAGQVLGFVAPSNHPAVHLTWVLALAMGWCVMVRPGADDPLTPWRLALALQKAGFPMERFALMPGGHDLVPPLIETCDRSIAYGSAALGDVLGRDAHILFNGPGHSKVVIDTPLANDPAADFLLECIAHDGGRKCTCASALILRGDAPGLYEDLSARMAALPMADPLDIDARIPVWKRPEAARQTPGTVHQQAGLTFVKPAVLKCADAPAAPFGAELPTPWATWSELPAGADVLPLLRGSLAVTAASSDESLVEACLMEPSIRKVYAGAVPPWYSAPGAPHQGRLAEFLFTSKAHRKEGLPWT